ncbi:MAG: CotH kinase family protein [Polyangiales bacterium]
MTARPLVHTALLAISLLGAACGAGSAGFDEATELLPQAEPTAAAPSAPSAPDDQSASHGAHAPPAYDRIFADDRVQRIDLVLDAETHWQIMNDLSVRLSARTPIAACTGLAADAPCSFLDVGGTCVSSRGTLTCRASDQVGAVDSVPGDPITVPVTVRYDGRTWRHVGMRFKGNSSLFSVYRAGQAKLPMRLDFDEYEDDFPEVKNQRFFGFDELTFSSGYSDAAYIREKLAADLMRDAGLVVARTAFYRVFLDTGSGPEYWGLYTMVEDPSDQMITAQFSDDSGNLYKPDGPGSDLTRFDERGFEKKSNAKAADFRDVRAFLAALHAPQDDRERWRRDLEAAFDVDAFLQSLAVGRSIDHWDAYGQLSHNYYLYGDPARGGKLVWISWDHNMTWTSARGRTPIVPTNVATRWPLLRNLMADPVYGARYRVLLAEFAETLYEKSAFDARATSLHTLITPYVVGPDGEQAPYTFVRSESSFRNALPALIAAADGRRAAIAQALAPPPPVAPVIPATDAPTEATDAPTAATLPEPERAP